MKNQEKINILNTNYSTKKTLFNHKFFLHLLLNPIIILISIFTINNIATAQITSDESINTQVNQKQNLFNINGGTTRGTNLFHSFENFSVPSSNEVFFNNANNISNIFGRVTGGNSSIIDGTIRANGNANLFLINPAGIVFAENARLNIGGSFLATTADSIKFNAGEFNAISKNTPNLQVDIPIGLGFGSNSGAINVQGEQTNLVLKSPSFKIEVPLSIDEEKALPESLVVRPNQNITLVSNEIIFDGGGLQAPGGNIELVSVANNEEISFALEDNWLKFDSSSTNNYSDITLKNGSFIDVGNSIAGNIRLNGREIILQNGSVVLANTLQETNNSIDIYATDLLKLEGNRGQNRKERFYSVNIIGADILSEAIEGTVGNNINIVTNNLEILDGGQIRSVNFSDSQTITGNINIDSRSIRVSDTNEIDGRTSSLITNSSGIGSNGNVGDLIISTGNLTVEDGARIKVDTFGSGQGGSLQIDAENIELRGSNPFVDFFSTGLITAVSPQGTKDSRAGDIVISANRLNILGGAKINSSTFGAGQPGNIFIDAEEINVIGSSGIFNDSPSGIIAAINPREDVFFENKVNKSGDITINTNQLKVLDGARIESDTTAGDGGEISINAESIELNGTRSKVGSFIGGISSSAKGRSFGRGGNINISTNILTIANGSIVRAISLGDGDGGNITIDAELINIFGSDKFASNPVGSGRISKINTGSLKTGGGNITINSDFINLDDLVSISSDTRGAGDGGNIFLNSEGIVLNNQSNLNSNTVDGSGGNITINSDYILGINNSDITANAEGGNGGNITINSDYIFGLMSQNELTGENDITVSSELGINGNIQLNIITPLTGEELLSLRQIDFSSAQNLVAESCFNSNVLNVGTVSNYGYGGLTENSENYFDRQPLVVETKPLKTESTFQEWHIGDPIIEATAVEESFDGISLVARPEIEKAEEQFCHH